MSGFDITSGEGDEFRRILIYFLLDVSASMDGAPLQAVQDGLESMVRELRNTPEADELAHLSVIMFDSTARVTQKLVPLSNFTPPRLTSGGSTNMAQAIDLVNTEIDRDFRENKGERGAVKGDYKPLIFLMTDGAPDDLPKTVKAAERLRNRPSGKTIGTFVALGCGAGANERNLRQIAPTVALMYDMTPENIRLFFKWVSATISVVSKRASRSASEENEVEAPPPPTNQSGQAAFILSF